MIAANHQSPQWLLGEGGHTQLLDTEASIRLGALPCFSGPSSLLPTPRQTLPGLTGWRFSDLLWPQVYKTGCKEVFKWLAMARNPSTIVSKLSASASRRRWGQCSVTRPFFLPLCLARTQPPTFPFTPMNQSCWTVRLSSHK